MNLPNAENALVEREKIEDYLLNTAHRYGASKAAFFGAFGFRGADWEVFAQALREQGRTHPVTKVRDTAFGPRYEIDGELIAPNGRRPRIRTVWQLDKGERTPRFITAHPLEANDD